MNSSGKEVDLTSLAYVLASTSILGGIGKYRQTKRENEDLMFSTKPEGVISMADTKHGGQNPAIEGLGVGLSSVPAGALEITLGYGLGFIAHTIINYQLTFTFHYFI